ncbi:hypothetical protein BH10PLA1_BH10PLA1_12450 [soil metagenome]
MVHASLTDTAKLAMRSTVCPTCEKRPAGSELWTQHAARPCEGECPVFGSINRLLGIAKAVDRDPPGATEKAVTSVVCSKCTSSAAPGEYCPDRLACSCPLFCHTTRVLDVLEKLVTHSPKPTLHG